ncbi:hypothetical protein TNCV_4710751 [Trichonephila clavipes]|uniref:Uncharacterized protein n=1 Tax=Trichonephila clavipes TaxID=2585209 RepID=A0A8X6S4D0_TRICX|nr:hypothetical protein TNCV_4710751 [Trichonephila clavipes]
MILDTEVQKQMSRSSGQSDAKTSSVRSQASLVLIYRPTERMKASVDLVQPGFLATDPCDSTKDPPIEFVVFSALSLQLNLETKPLEIAGYKADHLTGASAHASQGPRTEEISDMQRPIQDEKPREASPGTWKRSRMATKEFLSVWNIVRLLALCSKKLKLGDDWKL